METLADRIGTSATKTPSGLVRESVTVAMIRDLNNSFGSDKAQALMCPTCWESFTADLARYWEPRDAERFYCPDCDVPLIYRRDNSESARRFERLAQRMVS